MSFDQSKVVGYQYPDEHVTFNQRELILYALGIGVHDLKYTYELDKNFAAFPTYALVLPLKGSYLDINSYAAQSSKTWNIPGMPKINLNKLVHGEQYYEVLNPLPKTGGDFTMKTKLAGVYDVGKSMVVATESTLVDRKGLPLIKMVSSAFVIGAGGFGGPPKPKVQEIKPPARQPDAVQFDQTHPEQALLYRLSGDYNPLHADPSIGKRIGMKGAILHGLCTLGFASAAVLKHFAGNNDKLFKSIGGKFSSPVYPGDKLETRMWKVSSGKEVVIAFTCFVGDKVVFTGGVCKLHSTDAKL
ncbi:hypothetical protein HDV06_000493 [Boothiomyces sp. JEL0866]|nr:hypothetical protein HDV06_000493 [Boothiomyces sp. JEL0866]